MHSEVHTVHVFKIDATIRNTFLICVHGAALLQTGRLLLKTERFFQRCERLLPKTVDFAASLTDLPEFSNMSSVFTFVTELWTSDGQIAASILKMHTIRIYVGGKSKTRHEVLLKVNHQFQLPISFLESAYRHAVQHSYCS